MTLYEWLSLLLEFSVLVVLLLEYLWGRPDMVVKNEAKQRRRIKHRYNFTELTLGESK